MEVPRKLSKEDLQLNTHKKKGKCKVEVYSRGVGFYRPVQDWNKGKVSEFHDRKKFDKEFDMEGKPKEEVQND